MYVRVFASDSTGTNAKVVNIFEINLKNNDAHHMKKLYLYYMPFGRSAAFDFVEGCAVTIPSFNIVTWLCPT